MISFYQSAMIPGFQLLKPANFLPKEYTQSSRALMALPVQPLHLCHLQLHTVLGNFIVWCLPELSWRSSSASTLLSFCPISLTIPKFYIQSTKDLAACADLLAFFFNLFVCFSKESFTVQQQLTQYFKTGYVEHTNCEPTETICLCLGVLHRNLYTTMSGLLNFFNSFYTGILFSTSLPQFLSLHQI